MQMKTTQENLDLITNLRIAIDNLLTTNYAQMEKVLAPHEMSAIREAVGHTADWIELMDMRQPKGKAVLTFLGRLVYIQRLCDRAITNFGQEEIQ